MIDTPTIDTPTYVSARVPFKVTVWFGSLRERPRSGIPDTVRDFLEHEEQYSQKFFIHSGWTIDVNRWLHHNLVTVCLVKNEHQVHYISERLDPENEVCTFFSDSLASILEFYWDWKLDFPIVFNQSVDQLNCD